MVVCYENARFYYGTNGIIDYDLSHGLSFERYSMTKDEVRRIMRDAVDNAITYGDALFTCMVLKYSPDISKVLYNSYQDWLLQSEYFEELDNVIYVKLGKYDYQGKLQMFEEFLDQYTGEL